MDPKREPPEVFDELFAEARDAADQAMQRRWDNGFRAGSLTGGLMVAGLAGVAWWAPMPTWWWKALLVVAGLGGCVFAVIVGTSPEGDE